MLVRINNPAGQFRQKYSSIIVFLTKLWWTELKSKLEGCQFQNGQQLKNSKKNKLRTSKLKKDLTQIECFQYCYQQRI